MKKKTKSTFDKFFSNKEQKELYEQEYKEMLLSEMILAAMDDDQISVRKLAKAAKVSPTTIQGVRTSTKKDLNLSTFFRIADALGYDICLEKGNSRIHLNL